MCWAASLLAIVNAWSDECSAGEWMDLMSLKVFSSFNDSMILLSWWSFVPFPACPTLEHWGSSWCVCLSLTCLSTVSELWLKIQQKLNIQLYMYKSIKRHKRRCVSMLLISQFIKTLYNQYIVHYQCLNEREPQTCKSLFLLREQTLLGLSCIPAIILLKSWVGFDGIWNNTWELKPKAQDAVNSTPIFKDKCHLLTDI